MTQDNEYGLYRYAQYFDEYEGLLEGVFVAKKSEVAEAMGQAFEFGAPFGEHSSVQATITGSTVQLVTDNKETVDQWLTGSDRIGLSPQSGWNPIAAHFEELE